MSEKERIEGAAHWYDSRAGFEYHLIKYGTKVILERTAGPRVLEMGCASGVMTEELIKSFEEVVVVEGSEHYIEQVRCLVQGNVEFHLSLFEEFTPQGKFDSVIIARVLEHVRDPVRLLERAKSWLTTNGAIHIVVPNAESLHRRIGKAMGMINELGELHPGDASAGHRRVYTRGSLTHDIEAAGLEIIAEEGIFLKPLSNAQLRFWPVALRDAFYQVGKGLPEYCAEIYMMCGV